MDIVEEKKNLSVFMTRFVDQINSSVWIELKIPELLTELCTYFRFKRGFIYQTDGFRYFYLKETFGNEDSSLRERFELSDLSSLHVKLIIEGASAFYVNGTSHNPPIASDIVDFYGVQSLWIRPFRDTEGKIVSFIGYEFEEGLSSLTPEELDLVERLSGLLAKEIAIREYQERGHRIGVTLKNIMNNQGVDVYVNSYDTHDMLYANESMAAPYGGLAHFRGKKCWEALYADQTGECSFCPRKHLIDEEGNPTKVYSWEYQRPLDGTWFRVFSAAFNWTDGQLAQVITSLDITEQKRVEEELRKAKEKAEKQDYLKSAFFANMTHEIRTPLNAIVGFSSLLAETNDWEERQEYDHIVQENSELLLQLLSDILDLSRIESGNLDFNYGTFSVGTLCTEIVRSYEVNKSRKVPILIEGDEKELWIHSDKKRLTQVLTNFINNALKFTHKGQITIGYHLISENRIKFFVQDTGTGIEKDKLNQVFERFVKLNTSAKGTGLGLAISKSIIEQLDGTIGVDSEWGVGSSFWFILPYDPNVEALIEGTGLFL